MSRYQKISADAQPCICILLIEQFRSKEQPYTVGIHVPDRIGWFVRSSFEVMGDPKVPRSIKMTNKQVYGHTVVTIYLLFYTFSLLSRFHFGRFNESNFWYAFHQIYF